MSETYTENLADFGQLEQMEAINIFEAMHDNGLPSDFNNEGVKLGFNRNSGMVFLTNSEHQVAIYSETERGKYLESFYSSPYQGLEGTFDELAEEYNQMHEEDKSWFEDLAKSLDRSFIMDDDNEF
jgi:hypothetical protein